VRETASIYLFTIDDRGIQLERLNIKIVAIAKCYKREESKVQSESAIVFWEAIARGSSIQPCPTHTNVLRI